MVSSQLNQLYYWGGIWIGVLLVYDQHTYLIIAWLRRFLSSQTFISVFGFHSQIIRVLIFNNRFKQKGHFPLNYLLNASCSQLQLSHSVSVDENVLSFRAVFVSEAVTFKSSSFFVGSNSSVEVAIANIARLCCQLWSEAEVGGGERSLENVSVFMFLVTTLELYHNFPFAAQLYSIFMLLSDVALSTHNWYFRSVSPIRGHLWQIKLLLSLSF